jgi:hypothetical protein
MKKEQSFFGFMLRIFAPFAFLAVLLFGGIWLRSKTEQPIKVEPSIDVAAFEKQLDGALKNRDRRVTEYAIEAFIDRLKLPQATPTPGTTIQCPPGQSPVTTPISATASRTTCVAVTPTPTPTPRPSPTPTPIATPTPTPTPQPTPPPVGVAELPRSFVDSRMPALTGIVRQVFAGNNLQTVINAAARGDELILQAGATFTGNFTLPAKPGVGWIVVRSGGSSSLPEGVRVSPSQSPLMAKIVSPNNAPAIATAAGASGWRMIGLEITHSTSSITALVRAGDWAATSQGQSASNIGIDRCYLHGSSTSNTRRGVEMHGVRVFVVDSHFAGFKENGADSQAICGWNGAGPFKIVNNYLEAAGENIMFGGADPKIAGLIPSDIEIRRNLLIKPLAWKGSQWSVKNLFEIKNGQRILFDGNTLENIWPAAQNGTAINLKSVNQEQSAPWSRAGDITITNNTCKNCFRGLSLLGTDPSQPGVKMTRLMIRNNVWEIVGDYFAYINNGADDVVIDRNTINNTQSLIQGENSPSARLIFTGNRVASSLPFGVKGDGTAPGLDTLNRYFPSHIFTANLIIGGATGNYPAGNWYTVASVPPSASVGADNAQILQAQTRP